MKYNTVIVKCLKTVSCCYRGWIMMLMFYETQMGERQMECLFVLMGEEMTMDILCS